MTSITRTIVAVCLITWTVTYVEAGSPNINSADDGASPEKEESPAQRALAEVKQKRIGYMAEHMKEINAAKSSLKAALIADDQNTIAIQEKKIKNLQASLRQMIDSPISDVTLSPWQLKAGQIGGLGGRLKVAQVLNKSKGEVIIAAVRSDKEVLLKIVGADVGNLVDGAKFQSSGCMIVAGTHTYTTVLGGTRTIFELHTCSVASVFTADELKPFRDAADANAVIQLTDEEKEKAKSARTVRDGEAKTRRIKAQFENGNALLKKGDRAGARKYFEKAIAEDPDSAIAKEAKVLLEKIR